jgi:Ca2+-binding EF-hand superfamily protein
MEQHVTDRSGKDYRVRRPLPDLSERMLDSIETMGTEEAIDHILVVLSTIGITKIGLVFEEYDVDNSLGLGRQELRLLVKKVTMSKPTPEQIEALIDALFAAGKSDKTELSLESLREAIFRTSSQCWLRKAFEEADHDHTDTLDKDECTNFFTAALSNANINGDLIEYEAMVNKCMKGKETITFLEVQRYLIREEKDDHHVFAEC